MSKIDLTKEEIEYILSLMPPVWQEPRQEIIKLKNKLRGIDKKETKWANALGVEL